VNPASGLVREVVLEPGDRADLTFQLAEAGGCPQSPHVSFYRVQFFSLLLHPDIASQHRFCSYSASVSSIESSLELSSVPSHPPSNLSKPRDHGRWHSTNGHILTNIRRRSLMSFTDKRTANFLITRDSKAIDPLDARQMLRQDYDYGQLDADFPMGLASRDEPGVLEIADDAVLLMIGNTDELVKAVIAAKERGLSEIRTREGGALKCYFARIKVHWLSGQVDTLLAICGSDYYFGNIHHSATRDSWAIPGLPNARVGDHLGTVTYDRKCVRTDGTDSLIDIIKTCKAQSPDGWIEA
jgi:hypothetical protein